VRQPVFVASLEGRGRRFIGNASPKEVSQAIGSRHPEMEFAYRNAFAQSIAPAAAPSQESEIARVIRNLAFQVPNEQELKVWVTPRLLSDWMYGVLVTGAVEWKDHPRVASSLLAQILTQTVPYVALTDRGRLISMVARDEVAVGVAQACLAAQESDETS
jgi:hypothetical protein